MNELEVNAAPEGEKVGTESGQTARKGKIPTPDDPEFLVSLKTLCKMLDLPLKWARRVASKGQLPCVRIGPRLCFSPKEVREVLQARAAKFNQFGKYPTDLAR